MKTKLILLLACAYIPYVQTMNKSEQRQPLLNRTKPAKKDRVNFVAQLRQGESLMQEGGLLNQQDPLSYFLRALSTQSQASVQPKKATERKKNQEQKSSEPKK